MVFVAAFSERGMSGSLFVFHLEAKITPRPLDGGVVPRAVYWQVVNLNDDMCVLQLKLPVVL
jgi:hypothetical protein